MKTCIQIYSMGKSFIEERDWNDAVLSLRLKDNEAVRFWTVMDLAKEKNAYISKTDVLRELIGLAKPNLLTEDQIVFFRQGKGLLGELAPNSKKKMILKKGKPDSDFDENKKAA